MIAEQLDDLWLNKMPSDWKRSRIRNLATLSPNYSQTRPLSNEPCTIVPMELLSDDGAIDTSNQQPLEDISTGLPLFENGDVLFAKITPCMENGKGAFVRQLPTRYAFGSTEFHVLRAGNKVDGQFLYYATFNPVYRAYAAENMVGAAGQKRVSSRFLKDTRLFLPPLPEQQRIAAYLDASCAAIDAAVTAKLRQLETLDAVRRGTIQNAITRGLIPTVTTRTTSIQLIETIPVHWRLDRLKDVAAINYSSLASNTDPTYEFDYLEISNVNINGIVDTNAIERMCFEDAPSRARRLVHQNSTLISSVRPNLQAILFVSEKRPDFVCSTGFYVVQPNESMLRPKFIYYALTSDSGRQHFEATAKGVGYPAVDDKDFGSFTVPLPPLEEQELICLHLDTKIGEIMHIVAGIKEQIAILTSYRKSLIHECVTGQRRVTEADINRVKAHG